MDDDGRMQLGERTRRAVLGDAHVDRTIVARSDFNTDFQELITRYAWGDIWTRPGLPHDTRRLLVLAMMVALNRETEFKLHLRAAIEHGVATDTVKEVLLQTAIYCGVPAANTAFHWAEDVIGQAAS